jgi:tripartite-type tricarboxylate transporter receptor subunit TctC
MRDTTRRQLLGTALALAAAPASAQTDRYPSRAIRLVIGFAPGGAVDVVARVLCDEMGKTLGQRIIVENKTGASGNLASGEVARSPADGYTLMLGNGPQLTMNQFLIPNMPVDPVRDFAPIGQATTVRFVAVVPARNPAMTLRNFVAQTGQQPATYASSGVGSLQHLGTEQFIAASGAKMDHVPFRGSGQLINDLVAGHVEFAIDAESVVGPHIRSGGLRGLAVMAPTRSSGLPEVPTIREAGYGDIVVEGWQGLVAPAGTPADVVQRLSQELKRALEQPAVLERFQAMAISPAYREHANFGAFLTSERMRWGGVVDRLGLRP